MLFESERLGFRPWRMDDRQVLASLLQDPHTMLHWPAPLDDQAVSAWLERNVEHYERHGFSRFCCMLKSDGRVIGDVGAVHMTLLDKPVVDLGYIIHADHWRLGYGFEAACAVVDWLSRKKELGIETIVATMATDNLGSAAVARGLGMNLVDTFRNANNLHKETYYFELRIGSR